MDHPFMEAFRPERRQQVYDLLVSLLPDDLTVTTSGCGSDGARIAARLATTLGEHGSRSWSGGDDENGELRHWFDVDDGTCVGTLLVSALPKKAARLGERGSGLLVMKWAERLSDPAVVRAADERAGAIAALMREHVSKTETKPLDEVRIRRTGPGRAWDMTTRTGVTTRPWSVEQTPTDVRRLLDGFAPTVSFNHLADPGPVQAGPHVDVIVSKDQNALQHLRMLEAASRLLGATS